MTVAQRAVERARGLVGLRFRPQGREPELGLDCVGLVCAAFAIPPGSVPRDYRLRGARQDRLAAHMDRFFLRIPPAAPAAGDVGVFEAGAEQLHLALFTAGGFIHADARLRRVAECPGTPPWPMLALYRRSADSYRRD